MENLLFGMSEDTGSNVSWLYKLSEKEKVR
jgi:hypothetical protein